ncbi:MAG: nitroreductase family protein [Bacteroidota bacterium]
MNSYYSDLIQQRTSRRSYRPGSLPPEVAEAVLHLLDDQQQAPFGSQFHFKLIDKQDAAIRAVKLGTYGFIQGARYFIAGQTEPSRNAFLDYGYTFEKLILELTALGLGTCWLGGTFDRGEFARAIDLKQGFTIPAVTPVGYAAPIRSIGDQVVRLSAGSRNRLPWKNLFFNHDTLHRLSMADAGPFKDLLEAVRLAPSASNKQPWRIFRQNGNFCFCLLRTPGYMGKYASVDLQMIDMGIAMCHWELVARERGFTVQWNSVKPEGCASDPEFIISAITN